MFFLRELKEEGILNIQYLKGSENPVDMFTKNLAGPAFNKFAKVFVGEDQCNQKKTTVEVESQIPYLACTRAEEGATLWRRWW